MTEFLTIYPGPNIWDVWQLKDLPFSVSMFGVSPDRQLRIWVEDAVRLRGPGSSVADPLDLKGGQVEVLNGKPSGLKAGQRKEQVPGPAMFVSGPATLKTVRFFNRGEKAFMAWPHDSEYLLDQTYIPDPGNPATTGPAPPTIGGTIGGGIVSPIKDLVSEIPSVVYIGGVMLAVGYFFKKELFNAISGRKVRKH